MSKKITLKKGIIKTVDGLVAPELNQEIFENLMSPVYK